MIKKIALKKASSEKYQKLYQEFSADAKLSINYLILTICACLVASLGLISNSAAVIIGAMLIAPIMIPLRSLSFSALEGDIQLFIRSFISILGATLLAIFLSFMLGYIANIPEFGSELLARTQPNLVDLGIALVAGGLSGFAKVRRDINDVLAGTSIAVALMPPLCVVGLSLSQGLYAYSLGAFLLYCTNLLGISLACMIVFIIAGYTKINRALVWTLLLNGLLIIPLSASFIQLVKQERIKTNINRLLIKETITIGKYANSPKIEINWSQKIPVIYVFINTHKSITSYQVQLVEKFISQKMNQKFKVIIMINQWKEITSYSEKIK